MALSKLAISLIAGVGSVVTVGGITAGVVVSRQNATQNIDSSNDEFNEPNITNSKEDKSNSSTSSFQPRRDLDVLDSMVSDESNGNDHEDGLSELKEKQKPVSKDNSKESDNSLENTETDVDTSISSGIDPIETKSDQHQKPKVLEEISHQSESGKESHQDKGEKSSTAPTETELNGQDMQPVVDDNSDVRTQMAGR